MTKKIIGIGNAIVDILCKIDDEFLAKNSFVKNSMSLIDDETAQKLSKLKSEKITSGGSCGNTIAALAQLGVNCDFIGKVANDEFGKKYIEEIQKTSAKFINKNRANNPSAKSFILVSNDAHRTMCTFLGCASEISEDDIEEESFKDASILYLEGYLWDAPSTILALKKAINLAKKNHVKIAFSLSDSFCVMRHKKDFLELIKNDLDIVFANESEALELCDNGNLDDFFHQYKKLIAVITRSENGCMVFENGKKVVDMEAEEIEKLIDTTGAGDSFAAGFLYGLIEGSNLKKSAHFGNVLAAKIIQKFGARFENGEI